MLPLAPLLGSPATIAQGLVSNLLSQEASSPPWWRLGPVRTGPGDDLGESYTWRADDGVMHITVLTTDHQPPARLIQSSPSEGGWVLGVLAELAELAVRLSFEGCL